MLHTLTHEEFGSWGIPGRRPQIVYGLALVSKLASSAIQTGTRPIGGVLFGTSSEQEIRILAFRPIECLDGDTGAAPFSEHGEQVLGRLAENYGEDVELVGLQPVGWYRSRWEFAIQLNQDDLRVWNHYFPLPSQVCLVMRVQKDSPVRAGFFFRPPMGGPVRIDSSYRTFEIGPSLEGETTSPSVESGPETLEPPAELFTPPEQPKARGALFWFTLALASITLLAVAAAYLLWPSSRIVPPLQDVAFRFKGPPNRLAVVWNPNSSKLRGAERVELRLIDAESDSTISLSAAELSRGARLVENLSGVIEARMVVHYKDLHQRSEVVSAQYVGQAAVDVRLQNADDLAPLAAEQDRLKALVEKRIKERGSLEGRVAKLRALKAGVNSREPVVEAAAPGATTTAPPNKSAAGPIVPPVQAAPPLRPSGSPLAVDPGPAFGSDRAPARGPAPLPEPPPAVSYTGPSSGKFIWTGYLAPGQTVTIDGRRASSGSVNGVLPGVPVRISVYPGEFSASGLSVFSAATRHQTGPVTETRSAQNGWLNTRYVYDPARARDAVVSAAPSEAGAFKQLQIAGGDRPVSVVVVEWAVSR